MSKRVYLDANAGAQLRSSVKVALETCFSVKNPSSVHFAGRAARSLVRDSRRKILSFLGFNPASSDQKLIFTSGGTEACNQLIFAFLGPRERLAQSKGHILTSAIEHPAMHEPFQQLAGLGWDVDFIPPEANGRVRVEDFLSQVRKDTCLVNLMSVNNESGVVQPIVELARDLRANGYQGAIVSDFVQALGKSDLLASDLLEAGVDAIAISSHKIGAPSGTGAIVMRQGSQSICRTFSPMLSGGVQEEGFRPGTENLFGILAFAAACEETKQEGEELRRRLKYLRDLLWSGLKDLPGIQRFGPAEEDYVTSNTLMLSFSGLRADDLVVAFDVHGIMCSTGSACVSGKQGVSHVPLAMGLSEERAREVLRLSVDWSTTEEEIRHALAVIRHIVESARADSDYQQFASASVSLSGRALTLS